MKNLSDEFAKTLSKPKYNERYQQSVNAVLNNEDVNSFLNKHKDELEDDVVKRSMSKLYEFVQENNKLKNNQPTTIPGYTPVLVVNKGLIDISYVPTQETKDNMKKAKVLKRIHAVAMPKNIKNVTLDQFDLSENDYRMNAMRLVTDFIEEYTNTPKKWHQGMYLYGEFGVGKTFLMAAMANELAKNGFEVTLVHFPSFAVEMKSAISSNLVADKLDAIKKTPVLILDDIGADSMSSWVRDDILGVILEYRMQNSLSTFFTSNFSMKQFEEEHLAVNNKGDVEPLKAKRIMQRVHYLAKEVGMFGQNRRPQ
ncbi:Primosomal protein DnaI [Apilactobacillus kunkeei]|uniref:primosomal protein DnaI n=1 Tax=Apilactobacillus kunkeei TaxID=148814 RepID=UPI00110CE860|nr:primosomal protein DnaI [Apilactobacillus kunkeei]TMT00440.1 primosomal protein DnaI [Apilactobacillus kunkeei]CAI2590369.1 Primosomal protein DnaI [Apilactobacillus kunkeei]CAI2590910.1 Primosomal protein DnaI [Apilactobacillus kunkeei]CAI2591583.1 Primosomal protein DnaI [Apilactobacillus kunkeei]CAI2592056.1 Primosomal protein DnaI [Apilactobacillus kunkeei]